MKDTLWCVSVCARGNMRYNDSCHSCPRGFYADFENMPICTQCTGDNTATASTGSIASTACGKFALSARFK